MAENRAKCGLNMDIYQPQIDVFGCGMLSGEWKKLVSLDDELLASPVIQAWLADDDLQAVSVTSTCIGFTYQYQKRYLREGA